MPPDRLEAPSPGARASSTTTDRPARASVSADANPAYPAPMIATSQLFGSAASVGDSGGAASHQYGSWESDPDSVCMFSPFLSWTGNRRFARTPAEVDVIRALVLSQQALGLELHFLSDNTAIRAVAPEISRNVLCASYCPTDGHANPVKTTQAFARFARSHGAAIREGVAALAITVKGDRVTGVDSSGGFIAADRVIVAAGVNTPSLLSPLGADLPLSIRITHVVQSEPLPSCLLPAFGVANADCAGRQEADGRLRFSSGAGAWPGDPSEWTESSLAPSASDIRSVVDRVT